MFKLSRQTRVWVFVVLAACAVLFASANPGVGYAESPLAGPTPKAPQAPKATAPSLGTAGSFAALGGSTVTNTGSTVVTGDLGVWPGLTIIGFFSPGIVIPPGTIHAGDAVAHQAQNDVTTAYNAITTQPCGTDLSGQNLGSVPPLTLKNGGVFCYSSSAQLTGAVTLDGGPADVWVFKIGSALTTASGSSVVLINGASACNVFFQTGTSATLGTSTSFYGNILALASITLNTGTNIVSGRALARNGALTMDTNSVNANTCSGAAASGVSANKIFSPNSMIVGGVTTLTIALSNDNVTDATITSFTDNLPSGLVIANPPNASTTCAGGTLTATAGSSTITLTGGTIPHAVGGVPGTCTIKVNVTAVAPGSYTNALPAGALVTSGGNNTGSPGAVLGVGAGPNPAPANPAEVPEADTLLLLGGGIGGLATWVGWQWRKVRARSKQ